MQEDETFEDKYENDKWLLSDYLNIEYELFFINIILNEFEKLN